MTGETRPFDRHLEDELHLLLDPHAGGTIPAWRMPEPGRRTLPILRGAGAALTAKIAVGAVVAVMAAGATAEAVITHSVNPVDWARQVTQQVQQAQKPQPGSTSPASSATQSPQAATSPIAIPVVSAPALPTVTPLPVPSVKPLPIPTPSTPALP